jgi:hypothetical protein
MIIKHQRLAVVQSCSVCFTGTATHNPNRHAASSSIRALKTGCPGGEKLKFEYFGK